MTRHGYAAFAAALVACSGGGQQLDLRKLGTNESALQVCAAGPTVSGIDVSEYQGTIDWAAAAGSGIAFAVTRINDGHHMDPYFQRNWNEIQAKGLIRGAYQFYEPTLDPTTQANWVIAAVGQLGAGDLPVMMDVEWTSGTPNATDMQTWIDLVTQGTGKKPMIYTAVGYWNQYFNGQFADVVLWVANYGVSCPHIPSSWNNWTFWQWGGGPVPGISGNVDGDVFNGTLADLQNFAGAISPDNCTGAEKNGCGNFGCGCVDHQCNGVFCPGSGCSADHASACGNFGCGCADGQCSGVYCPGSGCTAHETLECQKQGCGCVDHQCNGGASCGGGGCTVREVMDCGNYGCNCVDHQCNGGYCDGSGCTGKESADCSAKGCGCVDHKCSGGSSCAGTGATAKLTHDCAQFGCQAADGQCSGGFCPGSGCTAKEDADCSTKGCGCVDHACAGGSCPGTGCTAKETLDCQNAGQTCAMAKCVVASGPDAGPAHVDAGASHGADAGTHAPDGGHVAAADGGSSAAKDAGGTVKPQDPAVDSKPKVEGGCGCGNAGTSVVWPMLALLAAALGRRRVSVRA